MRVPTDRCPKCGAEMEQGFASAVGPDGVIASGLWVKGDAFQHKTTFWQGRQVTNETLPIRTYRCAGCGFLESYAAGPSSNERKQE